MTLAILKNNSTVQQLRRWLAEHRHGERTGSVNFAPGDVKIRLKADRRELPNCPSCEHGYPERLPHTTDEAELRWFRCRWCQHIWSKGPRKGLGNADIFGR